MAAFCTASQLSFPDTLDAAVEVDLAVQLVKVPQVAGVVPFPVDSCGAGGFEVGDLLVEVVESCLDGSDVVIGAGDVVEDLVSP